jgi:polysaccharide pyruvyl transferase WcaK-like protein
MRWTRALVRMALKDATLLVGRDRASYETLHSLGFDRDRVLYVPDVAIQQVADKADIHEYFSDKTGKVVGVTISNPPRREMGAQVDFIEHVGAQLEKLDPEIYKILIMPSNYVRDGISSDYALCLKLKERLAPRFRTEILENRPYFPGEYTGLLSKLEFFITTRMHVAILATSVFVPTIAINTQHKIRGFMQNIDMESFCVDYDKLADIFTLTKEIANGRKSIVEHLKKAKTKHKKKQKMFFERLKEIERR